MSENWLINAANISPSARDSIHRKRDCPYICCRNMVRYGLQNESKSQESQRHENSLSDSSSGVDECDNARSQLSRSNTSPELSRQRSISPSQRRTPVSDDETGKHGKSLAKPLPDLPSDDSTDDEFLRHRNLSSNADQRHRQHPNQVNENLNRNKENLYKNSLTVESFRSYYNKYIIIIAAVVLSLIVYNFLLGKSNQTKSVLPIRYNEHMFYKDLDGLGDKYNVNDDAILQIQSGISTIFKREDTGSFIVLYDSSNRGEENLKRFNSFVNDVAHASAKYLRNESLPVTHLVVQNSDLDVETHGDLINKYRSQFEKQGVLLVQDLEDIPANLAMAFHYYCDEYEPLARKTALFFTLDLAKCYTKSSGKIHKVVETCLAQKWQNLPEIKISPLLNRVVNVVLNVENDF